MDLRTRCLDLLQEPDPARKAAGVRALQAQRSHLRLDTEARLPEPAGLPGRPRWPALVSHLALARRSPYTPDGRAALLHAVAHIEFNAINKAADANAHLVARRSANERLDSGRSCRRSCWPCLPASAMNEYW